MLRPPRNRTTPSTRGFTLVEVMAAVAVVGILAAVAIPSQLAQLQRARRADAIAALTRLQLAQEQYRAVNGRYAGDLALLATAGVPRSPEGLYQMAVTDPAVDGVTLVARARPDAAQHADSECPEITLRLNQGMADPGPSGRCWNR